MTWFKKILTLIALINLVVSPAFAGAAPQWSEKERAQLEQYRNYLEPLGYSLTVDQESKKALVYDKNTKKLAMEVPFTEESQLRKFSPKSLNRMLMDEMVRVKAASKSSWSHSVRNLPTESAIFFVAMGAVVAGQLITNYSQNPTAMKQHIDHSLSPLGVFGFFTFMYSQGVTSNVLAMYMKNPKFHHMIPYLGMTVGAFLQTYLSQVASDPNVMACAKVMMGGKVSDKALAAGADQDPCSKAYEYLVIHKKIWEFAPGIVSMLISSGLAGIAQSVLTKTVLRITGVDIALWLVPGSMQLKGIRLLLVKGLQITAFVALDMWLNRTVTAAWKNVFDGAHFNKVQMRLTSQVNDLKSKNWNGNDQDLQKELKAYHKKMVDWRMMNLSEVYEAHQSWSEALHQMTAMFNTSFAFYNSFVDEVRNVRFNNNPENLLQRTYPFNGVKPKDLAPGKENLLILNPAFIESMQAATVADTVVLIDSILASEKAKYLYPAEKRKIVAINDKLRTGDRTKIGEGLAELYQTMHIAVQNTGATMTNNEVLREIYSSLGKPVPMLSPGRGYLAAYEKAPATAETLAGTHYYRQVGMFLTPTITDYMLMQMACGPDAEKGERVIKNSKGFPSVFLPPQIRNANEDLVVCDGFRADFNADQIYNWPLKTASGKDYKGVLSYVIAEARPSVVGNESESAFADWWKAKTESQMQKAFEEYGKSYDEIVTKMIELVYRTRISTFNAGPVSNGTMNAAFQEERTYLSLLEQLLAPSVPFNLQMDKILLGTPKHPALLEIDNQFAILNGLIKRIQVVEKDGRKVIQSSLENYELEEQVSNIQAALAKASTLLGVGDATEGAHVQLNKQQRDLAVSCLENLQSLASEIMMYGTMANAVSWEKIRNVKQMNMEQQKFNNDIQAKLSALRGMTMAK
ncbi:hypothetical protein ACES2L_00665 [Bdellovibrio bacteriovorus]